MNQDRDEIMTKTTDAAATLTAAAKDRILILDGAMGTMLQRHKFTEEDFRGERFKDWEHPLQLSWLIQSLIEPWPPQDE